MDRRRAVFALVVALAVPLYAVPLHWGLAGKQPWAFDELHPRQIVPRALADSEAWPGRYPPLHGDVLAALMTVVLPAARIAAKAAGDDLETVLHLLGRAVSVALALGTLALVRSIAGRLFGPLSGALAAVVWLGVAPQVYYAKTMNLEAPYLFWFALSLHFYVDYRRTGRRRDLLGFALAGGCAILTKDQAYGLFVLPAIVHVASLVRDARGRGESAGRVLSSVIRDPRLVIPTVALLALAAVTYRVWNGWDSLAAHFGEITSHRWMGRWRQVPPTPSGQLALIARTLNGLAFASGWFGLGAGLAGATRQLWLEGRDPRQARTSVPLLLFPLSYYLTFVVVVRYSYDRFVLPIALVLSLFAGPLLARLCDARGGRWRQVALSSVVALGAVYGVARATVVDLSMLWDARVRMEGVTEGKGETVAVGGLREQYPAAYEYAPTFRFSRDPCRHLERFEFVAFQPSYTAHFEEKRFLKELQSGEYGFEPVEIWRFAPPAWLYSTRGVATNLAWIDMPILLFARDPALECAVRRRR